jgi:hypothetical protein
MNFLTKIFNFFNSNSEIKLGKVEFNDESVTYFHPQDSPQTLNWNDLKEVGIVTTDEGPYNEDVYFMLLGSMPENGCAIPQGAEGFDQLLERLQSLDNFDNKELIKAMGCTNNNRFVLWKTH